MSRLPGLAKVVVVLTVVVGLLYLSLYLRWPVERPLAYWPIGDRTLGILVGDGPNVGCAVVSVDESSDAVRVHAQCWERLVPVPQAAILQAYPMEVTLQDPLGNRSVYDGSGKFGDRCAAPYPDCTIPG
jgi:hypothetical protein